MISEIFSNSVRLSERGIFLGENLLIPITLEKITKKVFYSNTQNAPLITYVCKYRAIIEESLSSNDFGVEQFTCSSDNLPFVYRSLDAQVGPLAKTPSSKRQIMAVLRFLVEKFFPENFSTIEYTTESSGWHHCDGRWIYFTTNGGISASGITDACHCQSANAYLYFDHDLAASKAVRTLWEKLLPDFDTAAPFIAMQSLSLLQPLNQKYLHLPVPGLLSTGPYECGKTVYSTYLGRILTGRSGNLDDVFILQTPPKKLEAALSGLSDTTIVLDDSRATPADTLRRNVYAVLDSYARLSFGTMGAPLPLITGEAGSLNRMNKSWRSRLIELIFSRDHLAVRKDAISFFKSHPLVIRTAFCYFIQYLAAAFDQNQLEALTRETQRQFSTLLPSVEMDSRVSDNLFLSFWAFRIFLNFSKECGGITQKMVSDLEEKYVKMLQRLQKVQVSHGSDYETLRILDTILNDLAIHQAQPGDYTYYEERDWHPRFSSFHTWKGYYGHHSIIDVDHGFSGVLLANSALILGYPEDYKQKALLVISSKKFDAAFYNLYDTAKKANLPFPFQNFADFHRALRRQNILLGKPKRKTENTAKTSEQTIKKTGQLYKTTYPAFEGGHFCYIPVYVLELNQKFLTTLSNTILQNHSKGLQESIYNTTESISKDLRFIDNILACGAALRNMH